MLFCVTVVTFFYDIFYDIILNYRHPGSLLAYTNANYWNKGKHFASKHFFVIELRIQNPIGK